MGEGPAGEMPRYRCHKEVSALKIREINRTPRFRGGREEQAGAWLVPADEGFAPFQVDEDWLLLFQKGKTDVSDLGYYVVYADGYKSWSPTAAFEEGYERI